MTPRLKDELWEDTPATAAPVRPEVDETESLLFFFSCSSRREILCLSIFTVVSCLSHIAFICDSSFFKREECFFLALSYAAINALKSKRQNFVFSAVAIFNFSLKINSNDFENYRNMKFSKSFPILFNTR